MVEFPVGDATGRGYLALPEGGEGPGVLVLHAWWGLTPFFRGVADRLASDGYVALAPDLCHGRTAGTIEEAEQLLSSLDGDRTYEQITAAADYLVGHPSVVGEGIGAVGFSMGAHWALLLEDPVRAVVTFYGTGNPDQVTARAVYLGHYADPDEWEPIEDVRRLEEQIRASGSEVRFHYYSGAGHWFVEEDRPGYYDEEAARLAWERTAEFLHRQLSVPK